MGAVELLDGVPVPLDVAVPRRRRGVDAALALLEAAWWGLGCVCYACVMVSKVVISILSAERGDMLVGAAEGQDAKESR